MLRVQFLLFFFTSIGLRIKIIISYFLFYNWIGLCNLLANGCNVNYRWNVDYVVLYYTCDTLKYFFTLSVNVFKKEINRLA